MAAGGDRVDRLKAAAAFLLPLATILILCWPNLTGEYGLCAETSFDISDPLFGDAASPPPRATDDTSPVIYDWPRDRLLIKRIHAGHFDLWDRVSGNGAPMLANPGGMLSPLRLILYAAPVSPYTAFVLFRVAKLFIAAIGAYLLARAYGLSRPASSVASIAFGLSGGMISQLPYATVASVCWLPWVCWAQARAGQRMRWSAAIPVALAVAALATGGHQPIIAGVAIGALGHALAVAVAQRTWRARWRVVGLLAAGWTLGLMLSAPSTIAAGDLVANGHSYKLTGAGDGFRQLSLIYNRGLLFAGAALPFALDRLRERAGGFGYPYVLNFALGPLLYLLCGVALVWRRWRLEWVVLFAVGAAVSFEPIGFGWLRHLPLVKDILPRYTWSLCVLPIALAAARGVDVLSAAVQFRRAPLFAPSNDLAREKIHRPTGVFTTTIVAAIGVVLFGAMLALLLMWKESPTASSEIRAEFATSDDALRVTMLPALGAALLLCAGAVAARKRWRWGAWLLAVGACVEAGAMVHPHLRDASSQRLRAETPLPALRLANAVAADHARVGGDLKRVLGMGGWPEVGTVTPIAPLRYARFIEASVGPVGFTVFGLASNRSALADLAGVRYLLTPSRAEPNLDGDPAVVQFDTGPGFSIYRNDGALPRARVVHRTIAAASIDEAVATLERLARTPAHVAETPLAAAAIIEPVRGAPAPPTIAGGAPSAVTWVTDEPDEVVLDVDLTQRGYLVLADTYYPGWRASVDGRRRPIYPANVGFRAVYVEAGKHRVAFRFRPRAVVIGFPCAFLAVLIGVGIVIGERRAARRAGASHSAASYPAPRPPVQPAATGSAAEDVVNSAVAGSMAPTDDTAGRTARAASIKPSGV